MVSDVLYQKNKSTGESFNGIALLISALCLLSKYLVLTYIADGLHVFVKKYTEDFFKSSTYSMNELASVMC